MKNHSISATFISVKGAYDYVCISALIKNFIKIDIPKNIVFSSKSHICRQKIILALGEKNHLSLNS